MDLIGVIIAGIIIGLLGKFFAPGNCDNIPLWLTIVCGIGGVLIGYYLAAALGVDATRGIDWTRWIISITRALRQAGLDQDEVDRYYIEATAGDYDHLLQTTMRWVDCE